MSTGPTVPDLCESAGVEVSGAAMTATIRRSQARRIMTLVEEVTSEPGPEYLDKALSAAKEAETVGAHSVARALRWATIPETHERYGSFTRIDARVERVAERWLRRAEEQV